MKYGLIGEKLGHSYSKEIHSAIADYDYELLELSKDGLSEFISKRDFLGINVTIPYKKAVIPMLDFVSEEAQKIGAVNTVINKDGKLYGYNTDYYGLKALIEYNNIDVSGKKVLILGTGGTSNTAFAVLSTLGAKQIIKVSRTGVHNNITYEDAVRLHYDAKIIVNTTPAGMFPDNNGCPIDIDKFGNLSAVIDIIYNPLKTSLVVKSEQKGIKAVGGLYMLAAQAVYASGLFTGKPIDEDDIAVAYNSVLNSKRNIVLIGMPGCGKSTVGKKVSKELNRALIDTDTVITEKIGMPISEYFNKFGEKSFRDIETEVIKEVSAKSSLIIATGGGAVLRKENVSALKQNGIIVFLDRPISRLAVGKSRPLSSSFSAVKQLYDERYDIYCSNCDVKIAADNSANAAAKAVIIEVLK